MSNVITLFVQVFFIIGIFAIGWTIGGMIHDHVNRPSRRDW